MAQLFHPAATTIARATIFGALAGVAVLLWILGKSQRSAYLTGESVVREQPVQFSHRHHVGDDGIDCRYCHTAVERSAFAGIPPTSTCMNCHRQIWAQSPMLEPVRESYRTGRPILWTRVYDLPDYVYFNHSIHVRKGVGCSTCHGRVDLMPLVWQAVSLQMEWCLDCHRQPERYLRPIDQVFNMEWEPPMDQIERGRRLAQAYGLPRRELLTSCSICHH